MTSLETALSRTFQFLEFRYPETEDWSEVEGYLDRLLQDLGVVADVRAELRSRDAVLDQDIEAALYMYRHTHDLTEEEAHIKAPQDGYLRNSAQHFARFIHETWPSNKKRLHAVSQVARFFDQTGYPALTVEAMMIAQIHRLNAKEVKQTPTSTP